MQRAGVAKANRYGRCNAGLTLACRDREDRRDGDLDGCLVLAILVQVLSDDAGAARLLHNHSSGRGDLLHAAIIELDAGIVEQDAQRLFFGARDYPVSRVDFIKEDVRRERRPFHDEVSPADVDVGVCAMAGSD